LKLKKHDESGKSFLPKIKKVNHIKELLLHPITAKYNIVCPCVGTVRNINAHFQFKFARQIMISRWLGAYVLVGTGSSSFPVIIITPQTTADCKGMLE